MYQSSQCYRVTCSRVTTDTKVHAGDSLPPTAIDLDHFRVKFTLFSVCKKEILGMIRPVDSYYWKLHEPQE